MRLSKAQIRIFTKKLHFRKMLFEPLGQSLIGSIIKNQNFKILESLLSQALQTMLQVMLVFVGNYADGNFHYLSGVI
jgi:hypothetical protein